LITTKNNLLLASFSLPETSPASNKMYVALISKDSHGGGANYLRWLMALEKQSYNLTSWSRILDGAKY
jgi:hypothetical protein